MAGHKCWFPDPPYTGVICRGIHQTLDRNRSREAGQPVVFPIVAWFGSCAREHPQANALTVNIEEIREAANGGLRIRAKPGTAVQQMLGRIVRGIAEEWLWIDDEPRLSIRSQDVSGVQVRGEQRVRGRALREFPEEA